MQWGPGWYLRLASGGRVQPLKTELLPDTGSEARSTCPDWASTLPIDCACSDFGSDIRSVAGKNPARYAQYFGHPLRRAIHLPLQRRID